MNIKQATEQVEGAVRAYMATDDLGIYLIPMRMQRPIILMGPPGVGKTAIVAQVAERMGINFVSYSMTHHTRQSAIGLPYIEEAVFDGEKCRVSRYTMSEIIATVHDAIAASGVREGILFLDEVNCVSETLAPAMLQFLQFKSFGQHALPAGWTIVCAGNPPEYNRAARDFDPATLDRMKRIDIEPDLAVWRDYAVSHGIHPAIVSYLDSKPENFYRVRQSVNGTHMVTARGWEDLSRILISYESEGIAANQALVAQYLQDPDVAEDFALYLELFAKYRRDYHVLDIVEGRAGEEAAKAAAAAPFDERVALVGLLDSTLLSRVHLASDRERAIRDTREALLILRDDPAACGVVLADDRANLQRLLAGAGSESGVRVATLKVALLDKVCHEMVTGDGTFSFDRGKVPYNAAVRDLAQEMMALSEQVDSVLEFASAAFGDGEEMLILVSRLAVDPDFMAFVAAHGSDSFVRHSQGLMVRDRKHDLLAQLDRLNGVDAANAVAEV